METLGVIDRVSYKSGYGREENKRFFKIASSLFSIMESSSVMEEYSQYSKDDLIRELIQIEHDQQILTKLKGLSVLKPSLSLKNSDTVYFVLLLSATDQKAFSIKVIPFDDEEQATLHYDALEKKTRNDPEKSAVLVRSRNLRELKKAYPNYFLDTQHFVKTLEEIIR